MQIESVSPNLPDAPPQKVDTRICPKCKQMTKRIPIEITENDWLGIFVTGMWAAIFPSRYQALVCEHCANTFEKTELHGRMARRIIGFALFVFSGAIALGVIALIISGMINAH